MEYYHLKIRPLSSFATEPSSDTLAGQICYMLNMLGEDLDELLKDYESEPFFVVSDMLPYGYGRAFPLPRSPRNAGKDKKARLDDMSKRKEEKKNDRINIDELISGKPAKMCALPEKSLMHSYVTRNSINRLTGTTGEDGFAPHSVCEIFMTEDLHLELFVYIKAGYEQKVLDAIKRIGQVGFGKDASVGKGRFMVEEKVDTVLLNMSGNALYTLGNCVLEGMCYDKDKTYYDICTRFGKHGAGADNPFKNPVIMARQGALLYMPKLEKPYIGEGLRGVSADGKTVYQGYSLYIPINISGATNE